MSALDILWKLSGLAALCFAWEYFLRDAAIHLLAEPRAVWTIYRLRRQQRRLAADEEKRVAGLKARIDRVGTFEGYDPAGQLILGPGWAFDCSNGVPINRIDEKGVYRFCGYTRDELIEIHARRDEFADRPNG